jgi:hypothetical protein
VSNEPPPSYPSDLGDVTRALESIALELEIANHLTMFEVAVKSAAFDKSLLGELERARLVLNAAISRRQA